METSASAKGETFEKRVAKMLSMIGYEVEHNRRVGGLQMDVVAVPQAPAFPGRMTYVVECKNWENRVGVDVVQAVNTRVQAAEKELGRPVLGWIISPTDLTQDAKANAASLGIFHSYYDDLLSQAIDIDRYHTSVVDSFPAEEYLEPIGRLRGAEKTDLLDSLVGDELLEAQKPFLILGEPGVGKTFYARWLAAHLIRQRRAGDWQVIPILVPLDEVNAPREEFISGYLDQQGVSLGLSLDRFMRDVGLILILDGLDKLPIDVSNEFEIKGWLRGFETLQANGNKVIVTSRTQFFEDHLREILWADGSNEIAAFTVVAVEPFDDDLVHRYLTASIARSGLVENQNSSELPDGTLGLPESEDEASGAIELAQETWRRLTDYNVEDVARVPVVLQLVARHAAVLEELVGPDYTTSRVVWEIVKYDVERASSLFGQRDELAQDQLQEAAFGLWKGRSLSTSLRLDRSLAERFSFSASVVQDITHDILTVVTDTLWPTGCLNIPIDELLRTLYETEGLSIASHTVRRATGDLLMTLAREREGVPLSRDELDDMASKFKASIPESTIRTTLQYLEERTPILQCTKQDIGFAHAVFRDVLVANYLAGGIKAGSAPDVLLGTEMGRYVGELLEGQWQQQDDTTDEPLWSSETMAYVDSGPFIAGKGPDTQITSLSKSFLIGKRQVTNREFLAFLRAGGYESEVWWSDAGWRSRGRRDWHKPAFLDREGFSGPDQPVVGISFFEAEAYCSWRSQETGHIVRLPTSLEWEKGARGIDGRKYPWGRQEAFSKAGTDEQGVGQPLPVGHFSPDGDSPYGVADMAGNVWDWVTTGLQQYAVRGGSFAEPLSAAESANSRVTEPESRVNDIGFRVVQELADERASYSQ